MTDISSENISSVNGRLLVITRDTSYAVNLMGEGQDAARALLKTIDMNSAFRTGLPQGSLT